ncbi:RagB/SusD family nutrient uptake outer membrane protein [Flavobacterium sp. N3904]|uniref:RagB/SusD family nutrient uptake outer membrane protein n=1 Tax=Flavobacterium sp. N3904 TaxID=2986835 RepID=UPI002224AD69|nr:RagB/SusD family nutrient uptake outer membrane protein [Flavobacterium sp. N3904]
MKKYIFITVASIALFSAIFVSCSDNFTERDIAYSIDSENYFNSEADYDKALIGAYDLLQSTYINVLMGEIASDNTLAGGESPTDVIGFQQIDDMTQTPTNDQLKNLWDWMFAGVQRANYILEFKDKTDFAGKTQVIAETRFLRAYYHFELVKWFGGIPLNGDKRFAPGDETSVPRASIPEVYASIEADLIYASENLSPTASQTGRATKGAALALLGKAYLYQRKFPEAAAALEQVIASSKYSLVPDYASIFEMAGENGPESIFEVQYTDVEGAGFGCLQCSEGNVAVGFSGVRNYTGPKYTSGFSFNVPTQETYNAFEVGDTRLPASLLDIATWAAANNATYGKGNEDTGFFNQKYLPRIRSGQAAGDLNLTNPNNYRAIRYADVLLMAAEALNRGAINDVRALGYLNQVRDRAFGDTNHRVTAVGAALTDVIWNERRVELVGEGFRFFDLVRTGKAAAAINGFVVGKNELFPIPLVEIQFSNGNWSQNPGY